MNDRINRRSPLCNDGALTLSYISGLIAIQKNKFVLNDFHMLFLEEYV